MTKLKVRYFDFSASRGEDCRIALSIAGVEFEDDRIQGSDWAQIKPTVPFGVLPVLEVPGRGVLPQSNAILRYIGVTYGLHPSDPFEAARHDALMDAAEELRGKVWTTVSIKDEAAKKAAREELAVGYLKMWGQSVEQLIEKTPFLRGSTISVADIKLHGVIKWFVSGTLDHMPTTVFADFPKLMGIYEAVKSHPKVAARYKT